MDRESDADDRNPLERLIEEYLQRLGEGEELTVETFAAANPEHAEEILELLPTVVAMETYKRDREISDRGRASLGPHKLERLGDYRILGELGRGGMGIVFEALQESLGRKVAVKVLPNQHLLGERQLRRFEREARTAAALHHTNIVPIFGTGEQEGYHYYVMQLIRGIGLDALVRALAETRGGAAESVPPLPLSEDAPPDAKSVALALRSGLIRSLVGREQGDKAVWKAVARIGVQVASALDYAHTQGTLHRDIKPANLLLDAQGGVWVTDFGLSKALGAESMTRSGNFVGTLAYMAPEQFEGRYDERTDIHGLGLVLYELLTLRPAYEGEDRNRLIRDITDKDPQDPRRIDPAIPVDLETIVVKTLARDPRHRYQRAADLGRDLEKFLQGRPISARRVTMVERAWLWCARNPAMARLASLAALAVLAATVIGWVAYGITSDALEGERIKGEEARRATSRAEGNLALVLEAFEDIFQHLAGDPTGLTQVPTTRRGDLEPMIRPAVNADNAELLRRMLEFYDRFAGQNRGNLRLQEDRLRAWQRMGDIHQRLGDYKAALEYYGRALAGGEGAAQPAVEKVVRRAVLQNEIGRVSQLAGFHLECHAAHNEAKELLEGLDRNLLTDRARYELARTMNYLGAWRPDPNSALGGVVMGLNLLTLSGLAGSDGRGRDNERYHRRAVAIATELLQSEPDKPEYRFIQARSRHLHAMALFILNRSREGLVQLSRAIQGFEELTRLHPKVGYYRYEYAQAFLLAASAPLQPAGMKVGDCLRKGYDIYNELWQRNQSNPLYRVSLAKCRTLLASHLVDLGRGWDAMVHARKALELFDGLVEDAPGMAGYRILAMRCRRLLVPLLVGADKSEEALVMVDRAIATARRLLAGKSEKVGFFSKINFLTNDLVPLQQLRRQVVSRR